MYLIMKNNEFVGEKYSTIEEADTEAKKLEADSVVLVEEVRSYPRLFTEEQRAVLLKKVNLQEYASLSICGDGLEIDRAQGDFFRMTDVEFVKFGFLRAGLCEEEDEDETLRSALADFPELIERVKVSLEAE